MSHVTWHSPFLGLASPHLSLVRGLVFAPQRSHGAAEGLKTPGAAFRVPEDMVTPNLLHQDAGARMGGELPPYTPSIQASPSSLVQLGGSKHGEVSDA